VELNDLKSLLAQQPRGHALLQEFYASPEIFERDIERIHLRRWLCVGHESRIPDPGDWFRFDIAEESVLLVRGKDTELRALVNVCRHRGSRVCYEEEGHSRALVCPYHAWTYDLDGKLRSARHTDSNFDASRYSLKQIHLRVLEGLIFVCFADDPLKLDEAERVLRGSLAHYGWKSARIAHRERYSVEGNWKLVTENYQECYHCTPAHPEFSRHHATSKPDEEVENLRCEARQRARDMGIEIREVEGWPQGLSPGQEGIDCSYDATYPGSLTGSEDGAPLAPLMGNFTDYDGGFCYVELGPASFYLAYPDHGVVYLFVPRGPQKTDMEVIWLVDGSAQEDVDYQKDQLSWMWNVTSIADKRIIEQNQQGVNSRYYEPGPYTKMEVTSRRFSEWYLREIDPGSDA
jgi:Rieske 2Fe-2S family protein